MESRCCCSGGEASQPFLQILNPGDALLRIADHLTKQICKACLTELLCPTAIQRSVVYGLAIRRVAEAWLSPTSLILACQRWLYGLGGCHSAKFGKRIICGIEPESGYECAGMCRGSLVMLLVVWLMLTPSVAGRASIAISGSSIK